jgi:phospholipase/carboxylesterase
MMSLYTAPRRLKPMAGVLGYSGALLGGESLADEALSKPPVFLVHGDADQVVPVQALHGAVAGLQSAEIPVQWTVRPGLPHGIDPEGMAHGAAFLAHAFKESGA